VFLHGEQYREEKRLKEKLVDEKNLKIKECEFKLIENI
jgi:hypothetical protein